MREILFRGKHKYGDEWLYGYYAISGDGNARIFTESNEGCYGFVVCQETVGQYTGLTDKNGNKIFEGDILKPQGLESALAVVKYGKYTGAGASMKTNVGFYLEWINDQWRRTDIAYWVDIKDDEKVEIVGNVYDNPALLEKENAAAD